MTARCLARIAGVRVAIADLGEWGSSELFAEYDPSGPTIRVNRRCISDLRGNARRRFIERAVAHELYHHFEAIGLVARIEARGRRERAANAFAIHLRP